MICSSVSQVTKTVLPLQLTAVSSPKLKLPFLQAARAVAAKADVSGRGQPVPFSKKLISKVLLSVNSARIRFPSFLKRECLEICCPRYSLSSLSRHPVKCTA